MGPKDHKQKRSYLTHSPCCPQGERQNLEGMGETAAYGAKRLHIREDNIMPIVNRWIPRPVYVVVWYICDKLPYVRFYGFGIILLVPTDYCIQFQGIYFEKLCISFFNHSYHIIIIENKTCISPTPINYATYWALFDPILLQKFSEQTMIILRHVFVSSSNQTNY